MDVYDVVVVGGGIVGLSVARALVLRGAGRVVVLEAEEAVASHQTGHNSGVIHSGLYYKPGSEKARSCLEGREAMYVFCEERGVPFDRCGKVVVAVREDEVGALDVLERRGRANGLGGLRRLDGEGLRALEPHCVGVAGLHVPDTGIVDFVRVAEVFAEDVVLGGGEVRCGFRVCGVDGDGDGFVVVGCDGEVRARALVNCAGLQSDRVARMCGLRPEVQIVPFRGEYYRLRKEREYFVKHLIYPVPDPRLPFLGVHFTRMLGGGVEAGPNAVLAFRREGYRFGDVSLGDLGEMLRFPGFWRMARSQWRSGLGEMCRSLSKGIFVRALQELIPELRGDDVERDGAGVRAQAVGLDGGLVDDFRFLEGRNMVHVLNAPSPAATASIAIGEVVSARLESCL